MAEIPENGPSPHVAPLAGTNDKTFLHVINSPRETTLHEGVRSQVKPRILMISTSGDLYGAPRSLHLLATGLVCRGMEVVVAVPEAGELSAQLARDGVEVLVAPVNPYGTKAKNLASKLTARLRWGAWIVRTIRSRHIDLLYVNTLRGASAALAGRFSHVPVVWHIRGLETGLSNPIFRAIRMYLVARVPNHVIVVAHAVGVGIRKHGCPAERITVVHNGIGIGLPIQAAPLPFDNHGKATIIGYFGRIAPDKGVLDFLEAAGLLANAGSNVRFLLVGGPVGQEDNPHWPAIRSILERFPALVPRVTFSGFTYAPLNLVASCDVVCLPSHDEGFPRSVLEAMALGKAVVATPVGGVPEAIRNEIDGLLVPPEAVKDLATAWSRLIAQPELRARLGTTARKRVETTFTLDGYVDGVMHVLLITLGSA